MKKMLLMSTVLMGTSLLAAPLLAQEQERSERRQGAEQRERGPGAERERGPRGNMGERGPRGNMGERGQRGDFAARIAERMKQQLEVNDEEWAVIQPRLERAMAAQRAARGGVGMGMGGWGGRGMGGPGGGPGAPGAGPGPRGAGQDGPQDAVSQATIQLRQALTEESTSAEEINRRLNALREARKQAQQEYAAAQEELRELLTQRQEASLVMMGVLE